MSVGGTVSGGSLSVTGSITGGVITGTRLTTGSSGGNIFGGNINTGGIISATGNIYSADTVIANTFSGTATTALYADLAECYLADADYPPGTVVRFGGDHEVTLSTQDNDQLLAGIISTAPAYTMNYGLKGDHVVTIVLAGRAPCFCVGPVRAGDFMVSDGTGRARAEANPNPGAVIGKAIKGFDSDIGVIEVLVGRF
jgi:hypothetical protein